MLSVLAGAVIAVGCAPALVLPAVPVSAPEALENLDSAAVLARQLAPTLYLHPSESFPLDRVVAVVHPERQVIAYHLLWRDDVLGGWAPFTKTTDQEIVWVGYDSTGAATDLWTYWHGAILHENWRDRGQVLVNVQWGKHGSFPRGTSLPSFPRGQGMRSFYVTAWLLPDMWLGRISRPGPLCFCGRPSSYSVFTEPVPLHSRLDVIARTADPDRLLRAVFGDQYSEKPPWP